MAEVTAGPNLENGNSPSTSHATLSLDGYIAIGTVVFRAANPYPENDCWTELQPSSQEMYDLVSLNENDHPWSRMLPLLMNLHWIRAFHGRHQTDPFLGCLRIYLLPDDVARRDLPRDNQRCRSTLGTVLTRFIDPSPAAWQGRGKFRERGGLQPDATDDGDSLFYIFNNLRSDPSPQSIPDAWSAEIAELLLEGGEANIGVKTTLYPYQRRSIATLMERELRPRMTLDPRLEVRTGPTGRTFYYDRLQSQCLNTAAYYESPRGGILAESMGYGKTLIILGLVCATKDQMPHTPIEHVETSKFTNQRGARSLLSMTAAFAIKQNLPWRQHFRDLAGQGMYYERCMRTLQTSPYYEVIDFPSRFSRYARAPQKVLLCKTTLVVVPTNLFAQWSDEIAKHVKIGALQVLEVNDDSPRLAPPEELAKYDMILIEKRRFLIEMRHRSVPEDEIGTRTFPITNMHFLRLVVDEGTSFASSGAPNSLLNPISSVRVERRWIVSGTPTSAMVGVELDVSTAEHALAQDGQRPLTELEKRRKQTEVMNLRKTRMLNDQADLRKLGKIVTDLLRVQPWANSIASGDAASWGTYTKLGFGGDQGAAAMVSVKSIMQSLIVRHRTQDIEAELPPLHNKFVYLEPTLFDRFTMDLFTLVLCTNAVTSERTDQDYLFHLRNKKFLEDIIRNLRRSAFFWVGFSYKDMSKSLEVSQKYKESNPDVNPSDLELLDRISELIPQILENHLWRAMSENHELAFYVAGLPQAVGAPLGLDHRSRSLIDSGVDLNWDKEPLLAISASRLLAAQKFVRDRAYEQDPIRELASAVGRIANSMGDSGNILLDHENSQLSRIDKHPRGVPSSGIRSDVHLSTSQFSRHRVLGSIAALRLTKKRKSGTLQGSSNAISATNITISGSVSSKLSYLLGRVIELHKTEKILIFYEGDYIAWYIAQGLEALQIPHFIYANKINPKLRIEYHQTFMKEDCAERVMLIDLKQGGHGLNITSATRIFFVNPVWHTGTEAQAIKRAHRIGQNKPVHVETLVLKDSIEHKMLDRRRRMTTAEFARAKDNPLEDNEIHKMLRKFEFFGAYKALENDKQYAPITPAPYMFPELSESQKRDAAASARAENYEEEDSDGLQPTSAAREKIRLTTRAKKVARFA